jgi:Flp pilus assembly protein TadD
MAATAELHFQRAVERDPDSAAAHSKLGEALLRRGEIDRAIVQLRRAVDLESDEPAHARLLERALQQQRNAGEP